MLSPICYLLFLLSMIRYCVTGSDLDIQVGELFPSFDTEPNNLFPASESPDRTDTIVFPEVGLIQSIDQCRYNSNQKSRKMRFKRGTGCPSLRQPFRDNGRSGTEAPSYLPQIVPTAGDTPAPEDSVRQPNPDDNLCPPAARYPVCADPVAFPIAPDILFHHDVSRMQLKYCRASAASSCQYPGERFWCCDFVFTSRSEFESLPLLRIRYPDVGIGCVEIYGQWRAPEPSP